jgi:GrpB-like predicted nucleotidyltransferase (UPF0157 family)
LEDILIVPYDAAWPERFAVEAVALRAMLPPGLVTRIEHFGSTAVPRLDAKPIIDILVGVRSLAEAKSDSIGPLEAAGYSYWRANPDPNRLFLVKGLPPNGPRTHHLHLVEAESEMWGRLLFRDYLREHNDEAARYAVLKRDLAARFSGDREAYTHGKTDYVTAVLAQARKS